MKEICVVAPVFNEETNISEFVRRTSTNLKSLSINYEIILIDDGSTDDSWRVIKKEIERNSRVRGIKLSRNFGHHYAITAGLHNSKANWTVVMDSDLQDQPEVISDLYKKAQEGYDVVFVSRQNRPESFVYLSLQKLFYLMLNFLSGIKFNSRYANFSIINYKVVDAFRVFPENSRFYASTIKWLGFRTGEIVANHGLRFSGKPSYNFRKRFSLASDIILAFSDRPLKFAIFFGLSMGAIATFMVIWIIATALNSGYTTLGWPSIMAAIFFVGGSILVVLGIIGIYLGRVFLEAKKRPLYIIDEMMN